MGSKTIHALVPTGFGINCEAETAHAFRLVGAEVELLHFNDLIAHPTVLARTQILTLAGGFSFGDHLGAGRVLANRIRRRLEPELSRFIADGGLVLGICNGFQTMVRLGLVPDGTLGEQTVSLAPNRHGAFYDGWVTLNIDEKSPCVFTAGMRTLQVPVRHGEGRFLGPEPLMQSLLQRHLIPVFYVDPKTLLPTDQFPSNPNGSACAVAGVCDTSGRIFGLMPHPEAFLYPENHPSWRRRQSSSRSSGDGLLIFRNAVTYCRGR